MNSCIGFAILFENVHFLPTLSLSILCALWWTRRYGQGPTGLQFLTGLGLFTALFLFSLFLWSFGERSPLRELLIFDYQCMPRR